MNHAQKMPYITCFLVRFHRFCNVFDSFYSIFHIWIFGERGVEVDRHRTWLPRNFRNINVFCKNIFVLFIPGWSFHRGEKHDVWDCVNKDLKTKRKEGFWSAGLCCRCSCALNKGKAAPLPNCSPHWISCRASLKACQNQLLRHTGAFVSPLSRSDGITRRLPHSHHLHVNGLQHPGAAPQLLRAD